MAVLLLAGLCHAGSNDSLASLVRALRQSPAPARRAAVASYAAVHANDANGALAQLALGVSSYEQKDYAAAIAALSKVQSRLPLIGDYAAYYLAASRVEANDLNGIPKDLAPVHNTEVASPLAGRAWMVEARALQDSQPAEAVRLLREHYSELPQPDGAMVLADAYQAAKDLPGAVEFYQRVYYQYITGDAASRAAAALLALKQAMGASYPEPVPGQALQRADKLFEAREYKRARAEYDSLLDRLVGLEHQQAQVRAGAAELLGGNARSARTYLNDLDLSEPEADAERLYYVAEACRRLDDDEGMRAAVARLGDKYAKSRWRLKALLSAANRFLVANRPDDYLPLYKTIYEDFPGDSAAGTSHWKVAFRAYIQGDRDSADLIKDQLRTYPAHPTAGAALYFLGRLSERDHDAGAARAIYQRLVEAFPNTYYAMLGRDRMAAPEIASAAPPAEAGQFLSELKFPAVPPLPTEVTRTSSLRIERSRLLRTAGLSDLADDELRFGARNGGQPTVLAMELASATDAPYQGLRAMKAAAPYYVNMNLSEAPRAFWQSLFPLPYRSDLERNARQSNLDPFLVAGLIRQESEFNPGALSHANAYGLTQVIPATARGFARRAGIKGFHTRMLLQPATNLRIGTSVLRSMLDGNGGSLERTLASYNAGPNRVAQWVTWNNYREPAEFVESIPFTETRDYVMAVLRNADVYRRLYR